MYYRDPIYEIERRIHGAHPEVVPAEHPKAKPTPAHILWMCEQVRSWTEDTLARAAKAGRWIGWIFANLERDLPGWSNADSRRLAKADALNRTDGHP